MDNQGVCDTAQSIGASVRTGPVAQQVKNQIARFARRDHDSLAALAARSPRHADLLFTYPAAAVALARKRGKMLTRAAALHAVALGVSLAKLGDILELPGWLRKLPPEAFHGPLPAAAAPCPTGFARFILPCAPEDWRRNPHWVSAVERARVAGGERFAAWLGHRLTIGPAAVKALLQSPLLLLAAFAHAAETGPTLPRPWTPQCSLAYALTEARTWMAGRLLDQQAVLRRGDGPRPFEVVSGHHFVRLETHQDLVDEGRILRHCVAAYAETAAFGLSRLYIVQQGGARVATVEIGALTGAANTPWIRQTSAFNNTRPPAATAQAIQLWFDLKVKGDAWRFESEPDPILQQAWRNFWAPYEAAFGSHKLIGAALDRRHIGAFLTPLRFLAEFLKS